jgi:SET domain-containing protein
MSRSIVLRRSHIHGNGVFAAKSLPTKKRVVQYRGALLTHDEVDTTHGGDIETGHTFLFTLNDLFVIDGNTRGNIARWINHSCTPNCEATVVEHRSGDVAKERIFIETVRPVHAGEELTYDYGITLEDRHTLRLKKIWECRCGAETCSGTLLKPKRKAASKEQ